MKYRCSFRVLYLILLFVLFSKTAFAATPINSCAVITTPGSYVLQNDVTATTSPCISVGADNVSIDGQGHTITGTTGGGAEGIHVEDYLNPTISNIRITNFDKGISVINTSNVLIQNVQVNLSGTNIFLDTVASTTITGSTIASSTSATGILASDVTGLYIASSTFANNNSRSIGISSPNSSSNITITGDTFTDDLGDDLITFYGNQHDILVQNNSFTVSAGGGGVTFDTGTFTNTLVTNNTFTGVYSGVADYTFSGSNNIYSNNTFTNVDYGLYISGSNAAFVHNTVHGIGGYGVGADSGSDLLISDNILDSMNQGGYGFNITNMSSTTIQNNQVFNVNTGIHADTIDDTRLINNTFATSTGDMISISNVTGGLTISGNTVANPTGVAFIVSNADGRTPGNTLTFTGNDLQSNVYPFAVQGVHNATVLHNTIRGHVWIYDDTGDNRYSDASTGNIYYLASGTPSWNVYNILDSDGNGYADRGTDLPFASTTLGTTLWPMFGQDAHPATLVAYSAPQVPAPISSSDRSSGGSVQHQVANLTTAGNTSAAAALKAQFPQLFTTSSTSTTTESCSAETYPTKLIRLGSLNDQLQVTLLEEYLDANEHANLPITGTYSPQDEAAVIAWQEKYAADILTPWHLTKGTGYIYKTSLQKFKSLFLAECQGGAQPTDTQVVAPSPISSILVRDLQLGVSGEDVSTLQQKLIQKNTGPVAQALAKNGTSNYFGQLTKSAVIEFQKASGISPATGYYGSKTRSILSI